MNKEEWNKEENKEFLEILMRRFVKFYQKYNGVAELLSEDERKEILRDIKSKKVNQGVMFERFTYD